MENEDILESSLQALYGYTPIVHSSGGSLWTYTGPEESSSKQITPDSGSSKPVSITLRVPDTSAKNWQLHATSIWVAAIFIANEICMDLQWIFSRFPALEYPNRKCIRVLEIGAGAGLPSIVLAKTQVDVVKRIVISDYPDEGVIQALKENVERNCGGDPAGVDISVEPFDWLAPSTPGFVLGGGFELIIGADILWNSELHHPILAAIDRCLNRDIRARALLVAGLHTGRYTIQRFLELVEDVGSSLSIEVESMEEKEVNGTIVRNWDAQRAEGEDENERRRWVVYIWLRRTAGVS
jgi:nicotinamide N-methyltransferase